MLPAEIQNWKNEVHGVHLELLEALEAFGVQFSWKQIEKTLVWFELRSIYAGRVYEHVPYESDRHLTETAEWLILKTAQTLQHQGFVSPIELSSVPLSDEWVAVWSDVIEDPGLT
ncbi:hypothetical protein [Deinococcus roseus]|uniref:Uncharacterized protein n=1 Tax=Deinococcus roseus TaxID=392414 RepID=A0ABQ2DFW2_9DEIO|nr:hypothetical protein [Deinococcus roseus]GGJ54343.1 hypothetical protein GCM10008938_45550 [Deinococcus roseus]